MDNKELRILLAAETLIAKNGFHGISMHQLAKSAGIAVGTIYRYFEDKDALLESLQHFIYRKIAEAILDHHDDSLPLFEQYQNLWLNSFDFVLNNHDCLACKCQFEESPFSSTEQRQTIIDQHSKPIMAFYEAGKQQG